MAAKSKKGMVKVRCPNPKCSKVLAVRADLGGKKGRCPFCRQAMTIPTVPSAGPKGKPDLQAVNAGAPPAPAGPTGQTVTLERADVEEREAEKAAEKKLPKKLPQETPAGEKADEEAKKEAPPKPAEKPAAEAPSATQKPEGVEVGEPESGPHPTPRTLRRIAKRAAEAAYELSGNTLRVTGAIGYDLNPVFRQKCDDLLEVPDDEIIVDLGPVLYISSSHLGVLAQLMTGAEEAGKKITVRAGLKVSRVIRLAGLDGMCTLEVV